MKKLIAVFILLVVLLSACNLNTAATPTEPQPVPPTPTVQPPVVNQPVLTDPVPLPPNADSRFGILDGIGSVPPPAVDNYDVSRYPAEVAADAQAMAALGSVYYRIHTQQYAGFGYHTLSADNFSFARQDELVRGIQDAGLVIVLMLGPRDGNASPCEEDYLPMGDAAFADYVRRVVERYDGDGLDDMPGLKYAVHHWQLDNEVDLHWFGCLDKGINFSTPEEYVAALRLIVPIIRESDPQAVIFPSFWFAGSSANPDGAAYFEQFIQLGGADLVDAIDVHDYSFKLDLFVSRLETINVLLADHPLPIWSMEFSVPSDPLANPNWDAATHARAVVKYHVAAFAVPNVDRLLWFNLTQYPTRADDDQWQMFGSNGFYDCLDERDDPALGITVCGSEPPGPGGYTYQLLIEKLNGFTAAEKLAEGVYRFTFADGHAVYVLWGSASADLTAYGTQGPQMVTHIVEEEGQTAPVTETLAARDIPLSDSPIFVEAKP